MPELPHLQEVKASPTSQLGIQQREGAVPSQSAQPRLTVLHPQTSQDSTAGMVQTQHAGLPEAGALRGCRVSTQSQDAGFSTVREPPHIGGRDRDQQPDARSAGSRRTLDWLAWVGESGLAAPSSAWPAPASRRMAVSMLCPLCSYPGPSELDEIMGFQAKQPVTDSLGFGH